MKGAYHTNTDADGKHYLQLWLYILEAPRAISPNKVATLTVGDFVEQESELIRCTWDTTQI
jgi:hypothetical protein